ncbi:MAG: TetR/AcrR family transcriptional regulator [Cellvibrionaceae bacterium]|nr:TetR/AcrR family transcriptional regulator [Cellvibrionaceae bacterium]
MESTPKKLGRPRNFDVDDVLSTAVKLFWKQGYDGTSIRDLSKELGLSSPSLYAAFGDKEGLFLKAIEHYLDDDSCAPIVAFNSKKNIEKAVYAFMEAAIEYATQQEEGQQGCFMANCVSASTAAVPAAQALLKEAISSADLMLAKRFDDEKKAGNLPADFPSKERARLMFDLRQGHVLRARAGMSRRSMKADLVYRVSIILA